MLAVEKPCYLKLIPLLPKFKNSTNGMATKEVTGKKRRL